MSIVKRLRPSSLPGPGIMIGHSGRILCRAVTVVTIGLATGCASLPLAHRPVPETLVEQAMIPGLPDTVRFYVDAPADNYEQRAVERIAQMKRRYPKTGRSSQEINYLVLSGGGGDGAFGAGLLTGWSEQGTRPKFEIVTGVSIGAMIAPMAFLGPAYDHVLREAFTNTPSSQLYTTQILSGLFGGPSLADNAPLARTIARIFNQKILDEIAKQHRLGRRLLVGTTNLEAERRVVWDIGALANSAYPDRLELFHQIILASAAIPGVFPPVQIEVAVNSTRYDELHVDGAVAGQVFLNPAQVRPERFDRFLDFKPQRRVYVIRNLKVTPEWGGIHPSLLTISARSLDTLAKTQGVGDLYRLYALSKRDGMDFNLAYIPDEFSHKKTEPFDQDYMRSLFNLGYDLGRKGVRWEKTPPGYDG